MKNTKLISLLRTFSKTESVKFREFVQSPYFNKNRLVIKTNEELAKYFPDFESGDFTEQNIYAKVFGDEKFDYFKIRNIFSDIYQLALSFLLVSATEGKRIENDITLLNEFHDRKLDNLYLQKEKQLRKNIGKHTKDELYYYANYQLSKINTSHHKFEKFGYKFDLIQCEFDSFLSYSLLNLLKHYAKMLTNNNHGNIDFKMEMFEEIWSYVKEKDFSDLPSIQIYRQIIALELSRDEKDFILLRRLYDKHESVLSREDVFFILLEINSFAAFRLKSGDESYYGIRFSTFREIIEKNFFPENYILFMNFISVYTSACIVGEYGWAEDFAERFKNGISPVEESDNTINFCRGYLDLTLRKYDSALGHFAKTNFKLFLAKVMVRNYTIRILYEESLFEQAFSAIDSFRHYLKSEKLISGEVVTAQNEFLKYLSELINLKIEAVNSGDSRLKLLEKQINSMTSNPLGSKNWLYRKVKELSKVK
ncbi:MAG: hypothetical protein K1X85_04215 [Ignavibacteria bacterium]|nr:hypothetical protein [Ignavibacteria bacterium]